MLAALGMDDPGQDLHPLDVRQMTREVLEVDRAARRAGQAKDKQATELLGVLFGRR